MRNTGLTFMEATRILLAGEREYLLTDLRLSRLRIFLWIILKLLVSTLKWMVPHLKIISIFCINVWYISFPFPISFFNLEWLGGIYPAPVFMLKVRNLILICTPWYHRLKNTKTYEFTSSSFLRSRSFSRHTSSWSRRTSSLVVNSSAFSLRSASFSVM